VEPLEKTLTAKLKSDAVKQEVRQQPPADDGTLIMHDMACTRATHLTQATYPVFIALLQGL
jgi:hypothetical protein